MTKNTVKPGSTRKRGKRAVENPDYASFTRRILRAYARRVATGGDVEALRELAQFSSDVDAMMRTAVQGLRHLYSWAEIADRVGVSRQAVQMRYGEPRRGVLDRRLVEAGQAVTVAMLAAVFADHYPGNPPAAVCPGCGFRYPNGVSDCPTNATVRPVLYRRRGEDQQALARLTLDQFADLYDRKAVRANRAAARQAAQPAPGPDADASSLLDLIDGSPGGGVGR